MNVQLHSTYQPDTYYVGIHKLPKSLIKLIRNTEPTIENSRYTVGEDTAFLRGELTLNGIEYDFEVSLGSVDIQHAGYDWSDEQDGYVDEDGRLVDADEHAQFMVDELMSYACEIENLDVYLTQR